VILGVGIVLIRKKRSAYAHRLGHSRVPAPTTISLKRRLRSSETPATLLWNGDYVRLKWPATMAWNMHFAHQIAVASGMEYRIIKSTDADTRRYRVLP